MGECGMCCIIVVLINVLRTCQTTLCKCPTSIFFWFEFMVTNSWRMRWMSSERLALIFFCYEKFQNFNLTTFKIKYKYFLLAYHVNIKIGNSKSFHFLLVSITYSLRFTFYNREGPFRIAMNGHIYGQYKSYRSIKQWSTKPKNIKSLYCYCSMFYGFHLFFYKVIL